MIVRFCCSVVVFPITLDSNKDSFIKCTEIRVDMWSCWSQKKGRQTAFELIVRDTALLCIERRRCAYFLPAYWKVEIGCWLRWWVNYEFIFKFNHEVDTGKADFWKVVVAVFHAKKILTPPTAWETAIIAAAMMRITATTFICKGARLMRNSENRATQKYRNVHLDTVDTRGMREEGWMLLCLIKTILLHSGYRFSFMMAPPNPQHGITIKF